MTFLSIRHISKQYDEHNPALTDFSLDIAKGEVWSLVGESGSGKSSLLRIVAGLEVQDSGEVHVGGSKILNPAQKLVPGYEEIQLIHQQHDLYPNSTVAQNIVRPLLLFDKAYKEERLELLLDLLQLGHHKDKLPRELSGGQQQKVAIARALSIEPEVLLLDEPFSSLDNIQKRELIAELKLIFQQLKVTVLLVTHDIDDAMIMTENLCIIKNGRIVQQGEADQIFQKPSNYYVAKLFTELNPLPKQQGAYVRPSDLVLEEGGSGVRAVVKEAYYLVAHNLLSVAVDGVAQRWKVEDQARKYRKGDEIRLSWDHRKVLFLK